MELGELQKNWEEFGRIDPLWAVLTDPSKKNNRWDPQEFFATGENEIACLMDHVATLPLSLRRGRALDFGYGIGRLTLALCRHFEQCVGVDIAPSMIELAREHNRFGDRCQYYVNAAADLRMFEAGRFDFIYSNLVTPEGARVLDVEEYASAGAGLVSYRYYVIKYIDASASE